MYIWSKIGFNFHLLHQILSEVHISRWPNFNLFINWNRCSISLVDQMVIVTTEKSTLFYEKWTLPAAAFWLGWARMCRKNMLTGSLLVPSLLKPRALWDEELIGCSSGMENILKKKKKKETFCPPWFDFIATGIPLQKKCKAMLVWEILKYSLFCFPLGMGKIWG